MRKLAVIQGELISFLFMLLMLLTGRDCDSMPEGAL
jgi:hypothetical protein